jgi:hypothetical protein
MKVFHWKKRMITVYYTIISQFHEFLDWDHRCRDADLEVKKVGPYSIEARSSEKQCKLMLKIEYDVMM